MLIDLEKYPEINYVFNECRNKPKLELTNDELVMFRLMLESLNSPQIEVLEKMFEASQKISHVEGYRACAALQGIDVL